MMRQRELSFELDDAGHPQQAKHCVVPNKCKKPQPYQERRQKDMGADNPHYHWDYLEMLNYCGEW